MHAIGVAVRVLVVVVAVGLLWGLSLLVGSQEDTTPSEPITAQGPAGTERAVPGGPPEPVEDAPPPTDTAPDPAPAPEPAPAPDPAPAPVDQGPPAPAPEPDPAPEPPKD